MYTTNSEQNIFRPRVTMSTYWLRRETLYTNANGPTNRQLKDSSTRLVFYLKNVHIDKNISYGDINNVSNLFL